MPQTPQLILDSIAFERDDCLLFSGICLSLESGDVLQIEGPNGVGKTTLLRILSTALIPTAGKLLWQGSDVARHRQLYLQNLLFLGHLPGLKQSLSPTENLVWWRRIHRDHSPLKNEEILASLIRLCYSAPKGLLTHGRPPIALCRPPVVLWRPPLI